MIKFSEVFPDLEIVHALRRQLSTIELDAFSDLDISFSRPACIAQAIALYPPSAIPLYGTAVI